MVGEKGRKEEGVVVGNASGSAAFALWLSGTLRVNVAWRPDAVHVALAQPLSRTPSPNWGFSSTSGLDVRCIRCAYKYIGS